MGTWHPSYRRCAARPVESQSHPAHNHQLEISAFRYSMASDFDEKTIRRYAVGIMMVGCSYSWHQLRLPCSNDCRFCEKYLCIWIAKYSSASAVFTHETTFLLWTLRQATPSSALFIGCHLRLGKEPFSQQRNSASANATSHFPIAVNNAFYSLRNLCLSICEYFCHSLCYIV